MKRIIYRFLLLACIPLFSVACSGSEKLQGDEFLIEGEISGVEDGAVIYLNRRDGDMGILITTDTVRNGRFVFKEEAISNPERLTVLALGEGFPPMPLDVWVAPKAKISIKGKGKLLPAWEVKSNVPYQKEENRYAKASRDIMAEYARLSIEGTGIRKKMAAASNDEAIAYRKATDSIRVIQDSLRLMRYFADAGIMEKTDISPIWLDKLHGASSMLRYSKASGEYVGELRKKTEALYGRLSEEDKTTPLGYRITAELFPPVVVGVGDDMADADFFDTDGNTKHLSDYSGKYLLLDFWSRGCGPCIMALPEMKEISETYSENLTIISISLDTDNVWKEAMTAHDMPWVNIRDPKAMGGLAANYGVSGIPNYVMISPQGKVVDKWMGFGDGFIKEKVSENINK
jgi:thiol-disulfide isomerase/thioredoxin